MDMLTVFLCNTAKTVHLEMAVLYFTVIRTSFDLSFSSFYSNKNFFWFIIFIMKQASLYIWLK